MKILLMTLPNEGEFINWTTSKKIAPSEVKYIPLGILSLASNISKKHEVILLDPNNPTLTIEQTAHEIELINPDILGVSIVTRRIYSLYELLKLIHVPYIAAGGPHCTYYANDLLARGIDAVFIGNLADSEFNEAIESSPLPKGIIDCVTDINAINFPNRTLINIEKYHFKGKVLFSTDNRMSMFSSVGCPNKCFFCNVQSNHISYKNSTAVVDEMEYLHSLGCESVHILDDNFNVNRKHLREIVEELNRRNWKREWSGRGQVNMDFSIIPELVETGFKRIHAGIEALDDKILRWFKKPLNTETIYKFCNVMSKMNVDVLGYFIIGSPIETEEYRKTLLSTIQGLGIKYPFFNVLFPEPNTAYYDSLIKDGWYEKDYWGEYMKNPVPDYEIPYPYGNSLKDEIFAYANELIDASLNR